MPVFSLNEYLHALFRPTDWPLYGSKYVILSILSTHAEKWLGTWYILLVFFARICYLHRLLLFILINLLLNIYDIPEPRNLINPNESIGKEIQGCFISTFAIIMICNKHVIPWLTVNQSTDILPSLLQDALLKLI